MKTGKLIKNTFMLYILTFSNYFFSFITVPYQTRILGPEYYGKIGFALAFVTYFQLFMDFGFILYATQEVAKNRDNKDKINKIYTAVFIIKLFLIFISFIVMLIICLTIEKFRADMLLYFLFLIYVAFNALVPDFLYRGLEDMTMITVRSVAIKLLFTIMIFIFLKERTQYYLVPILQLIGSFIALIVVYYHAFTKMDVKFVKTKLKYVKTVFMRSSHFFYSRIANTVFSSTNTFIIGIMYPNSTITGLYTSPDKLISTIRTAYNPIADSLYPYMVKEKEYNLIKKVMAIFIPLILIGCTILMIFSESICVLLFGEEYRSAGKFLRLMTPILLVGFPNIILGYPMLTPMGLTKYANISIIFGAVIQVIGILLMLVMNIFSVEKIIILTIITEIMILLYRSYIIYSNRRKMQNGYKEIKK